MRKKYFTRIVLTIIVFAGIFLVYRSWAAPAGDSSNKETLDACSTKKDGKMIWENFSQQFFSSI